MLADPRRMHADLVGEDRLLADVEHQLVRRARVVRVVVVAEREVAEFHACSFQSSAVKPEALTTGCQRARSALNAAVKAAGPMATGSLPNFSKLCAVSGTLTASAIAAASELTVAAGGFGRGSKANPAPSGVPGKSAPPLVA